MMVCGSKAGNMDGESIETCGCEDCVKRRWMNDYNWHETIGDVPMEWVYEKFVERMKEEQSDGN